MSFTRRYTNFPGTEVIKEIEGIVIIDEPSPPSTAGVGSGTCALLAEFADVTNGVAIDSNGVVTTFPNPVEIFSGTDMISKVGGWDETIGQFGGDGGNGFVEVRNKTYARLIVVPINIASSQGGRVWRLLPTCKSATDPTPVVPIVGASVPAGYEFRSGTNRVRTAQLIQFSSRDALLTGVDGATTALGSTAATQPFVSAGGGFTTVVRPDGSAGVLPGDIIVLGVIGGAAGLGANANTYRVVSVTNDTTLVLQKMDGTVFDWTTTTNQPWRFHTSDCADSGAGAALATQTGYRVPMRPLDATIAINTLLTPTVVPTALTANTADPLSGLMARSAGVTGIVYTAAVQAPNAASSSGLEALYVSALASLLQDDTPENEVNIVWSARYSAVIDQSITAHIEQVKTVGMGRIGIVSPSINTLSLTTILGNAAQGAGYSRSREGQFSWPGFQTFVPEAVGFNIKGADGNTYTNGILDTPASGWLVAVESQLPPERNPGQASDPVKTVMANTLGMQRGISGLGINEYKQLKAKGVIAGRNDKKSGRIFQSGVTRSIVSGETLINVRRFSFFVQDSLTDVLSVFTKELLTERIKDQILGVHVDFFEDLLSSNNPSNARIAAYVLDPVSGNSPELEDNGIFVVKHSVEMLSTADNIVLQSEVGYGFINVQQLAA